jgi:hypothetical protein
MKTKYKCPDCGYEVELEDSKEIISCPTCKSLANFSPGMRPCCPICRSVLFKKWDTINKPCPKCGKKMIKQ